MHADAEQTDFCVYWSIILLAARGVCPQVYGVQGSRIDMADRDLISSQRDCLEWHGAG